MYCRQCGADSPEGSGFCYVCGAYLPTAEGSDPTTYSSEVVHDAHVPAQNRTVALLLAVIPGFLDVFGLGHIYLKRYLTGGLFLFTSVVIFGLRTAFDVNEWGIYFTLGTLAIFILQVYDIFRIVYE